MRKQLNIYMLLITTLLVSSCGENDSKTNKRKADFLPPMKIEISDNIKSDSELVDLVKSSEKSINEFSDNIEQLLVDGKDVLREDFDMEEASIMEKLKVGKLVVEFGSNSSQMLITLQKFESYVQEKQKQGLINEEQLAALQKVGESFKTRMDEINTKYQHYFDK
jgi:PBP1b-binding outer membrane lipoprotein LpoB